MIVFFPAASQLNLMPALKLNIEATILANIGIILLLSVIIMPSWQI